MVGPPRRDFKHRPNKDDSLQYMILSSQYLPRQHNSGSVLFIRFCFEIPKISRWRIEQNFPDFPAACDVNRNFREFNHSNFRSNGPFLGHSAISGFSGDFSSKFSYHFSQFQNYRIFFLEWKAPLASEQIAKISILDIRMV